MPPFVSNLNHFLASATLISQAFFVVFVVAYLLRKKNGAVNSFFQTAAKYALPLAFLLAVDGTVVSLTYSEMFGFVPCGHCWFQRIFLYPQTILLGLALWKKDSHIADYIIALSILGAIIALDQHSLQMGGNGILHCPTANTDTCAKRILFEFNYITFPLMSFTAFVWQIGLMALLQNDVKTKQ